MATEIKVPSLGESITEATVAKWLKRPGEAVAADEPIAELETDKVTLEVPAPASGTLAEILAEEGANVPVGAVLGRIADGLAGSPSPSPAAIAPGPSLSRIAGEGCPERSEEGEGQPALERSGPAVRKLIEESGLDATKVAADRTGRPDHQGGRNCRKGAGPRHRRHRLPPSASVRCGCA